MNLSDLKVLSFCLIQQTDSYGLGCQKAKVHFGFLLLIQQQSQCNSTSGSWRIMIGCLIKKGSLLGTLSEESQTARYKASKWLTLWLLLASLFNLDEDEDEEDSCREFHQVFRNPVLKSELSSKVDLCN
ncbi:hypothetical protein HAX54_031061 [Datura stramonium]|uniref:Uncharacterized protein n=1 Tax=Datura stramonium TaxID=4076 RepID=A0ABS8V8L1_DATST|nr:hypothetical protein [Datura stramonium]